MRRPTATTVALAAWLSPLPASAGAAVALALAVEGEVEPALEAFTELEVGASYRLAARTEVEFLLYATCESVVVRGGSVSFTAGRYRMQEGELVSAEPGECPERVPAPIWSEVHGVLIAQHQGGGDLIGALVGNPRPDIVLPLGLGPAPRLVFLGALGADCDGVRVLQAGTVLLEAPLASRRFDWPAGRAPLLPAVDYALELTRDGGAKLRIPFRVRTRQGAAPFTVLHLD